MLNGSMKENYMHGISAQHRVNFCTNCSKIVQFTCYRCRATAWGDRIGIGHSHGYFHTFLSLWVWLDSGITKAITFHTSVVVFWGTHRHQSINAYATVGLTWLFISLFVALGVCLKTHGSSFYENPDGVSSSLKSFRLVIYWLDHASIGAGLVTITKQNNLPVNTFGFGPQWSYHSSLILPCSLGPEATSPLALHTGGNFECTKIRMWFKTLTLMAGNGDL